jgi:ferredoxin
MMTLPPDYTAITLNCPQLTNLRDAVYEAGHTLLDRCGGVGACFGCGVLVLSGECSPPSPLEEAAVGFESGERLACQCDVVGTLTLGIPRQMGR